MSRIDEAEPLVGTSAPPSPDRRRRAFVGGVALLSLVVGGALAAAFSTNGGNRGTAATRSELDSASSQASSAAPSSSSGQFLVLVDATDDMPSMSVSNKYIAADGPDKRPHRYPWMEEDDALLEPFHATTFSLTDTRKLSKSYTWTIYRQPSEQNEHELDLKASRRRLLASKGLSQKEIDSTEPEYDDGVVVQKKTTSASQHNTFVHEFDELGKHVIEAKDEESGATVQQTVHIRYVRRNMRTVDHDDHAALFAAWKVLLETSDEEGVAKYGSNFRSQGRLSAEHNNLAGDRLCDHLHDGMGFIPGHMSISRLFEASLQSVNSSVSLPYWEYTMDVEDIIAYHKSDFTHWRNIHAFSDKWFGKTNALTGHVESGFFSNWKLDGNEYSDVTNSWGLIRAPWNNLKDEHFARYMGGGSTLNVKPVVVADASQMSSCASVYQVLDTTRTLESFNSAGGSVAHGSIHMFTGGQSNTPDMVPRLEEIFQRGDAGSDADALNQYWTSGVSFFDATIKRLYRYHLYNCPESCDTDSSMETCRCTCSSSEIMGSDYNLTLFSGRLDEYESLGLREKETLVKMLDLLCDDYHNLAAGDHASSASASDPSFFFIHGPMERWLQMILIHDYFTDESWARAVFRDNVHPFSTSCYGHHAVDKLVFGEVDGNDFTNEEYYSYLNPKSNNLPYVYDNLKWDHCKVLGYDIEKLLSGGAN